MSSHDYSPSEGLDTLIRKLRERDEELADHIEGVINAGKDTVEQMQVSRGRKKTRPYRRTVPFSDEEALKVAIDALQAYFVELPLAMVSLADNFARTTIALLPPQPTATTDRLVVLGEQGNEKIVEIELQTETQIIKFGEETLTLIRPSEEQILEQEQGIKELRQLIDFS